MDSSRKSNKIRDIVRLQQILKKWKKLANSDSNNTGGGTTTTTSINAGGSRGIKFLKKTLSFSELSSSTMAANASVPKGYVAVCVGRELKRFVIPTEYLSHQAFGILLREAEEEFGFEQEGVLKFPCEVDLFEKILKMTGDKKFGFLSYDELALIHGEKVFVPNCGKDYSTDHGDLTPSHRGPLQMCR